jgi:transcriptional regulator GlxA family with amidase domain
LLTAPGALSAELKRLKLEELLAYLLHTDAAKLQSLRVMAGTPEDYIIRKAVESHIGEPVTVEELAFLCNMSRATFQRRFEKIYNTSPQKYLRTQIFCCIS